MNSELRGDRHGATPLEVNPALSDYREEFTRPPQLAGERGCDKLAERTRQPFSRRRGRAPARARQ